MNAENSLATLAQETGADIPAEKSGHYLKFYEDFFADRRLDALNIVEIGILNGGSTLMFAKYFPNARMVSIDINRPPNALYVCLKRDQLEDRIAVAIGSQDDEAFLEEALQNHFGGAPIDLVIDDASPHVQVNESLVQLPFRQAPQARRLVCGRGLGLRLLAEMARRQPRWAARASAFRKGTSRRTGPV